MTGCTPFLVNMTSIADHKLRKADPRKLAAKYGLLKWPWGETWCAKSIEKWLARA